MNELPKTGDTYKCDSCGMTLVCTVSCGCSEAACVTLECCDEPMCKQECK
jgi:hypothetical protein